MNKIKLTTQRINEQTFPADMRMETVEQCLLLLVKFEIGYGGRITELEKTKISVRTSVMNCVDTTTFQGDEEDMAPLYMAAAMDALITNCKMEQNNGNPFSDKDVSRLMDITGGNPLLLKMGAGMILGGGQTKAIYVAMCNPTNEVEVKHLASKNNDELYSLACLKTIDKVSDVDFKELAYA